MAGRIDCRTHIQILPHALDGQRPVSEAGTFRASLIPIVDPHALYESRLGPVADRRVRVVAKEPLPSLKYTIPHENKTIRRGVEYALPQGLVDVYEMADGSEVWQDTESSEKYHYHFRMGLEPDDATTAIERTIRQISLEEAISAEEAKKLFVPELVITPELGVLFGPGLNIARIAPEEGLSIAETLPQVAPDGEWDPVEQRVRRGEHFFEYKAANLAYDNGNGILLKKELLVFGFKYISERFEEIDEAINVAMMQGASESEIPHIVAPYVRVHEV